MKAVVFLLLLSFGGLAVADPVTLIYAAVSYLEATGVISVWTALAIAVSIQVYGSSQARRSSRIAAARARAAYNSSLTDRSLTVLQAEPPWRVVYGRALTGGDIVAVFTSDKAGTREDGSSYTRADALKHLVIVCASHEVQAINEIYIEGVPVGTLDGSGYPTGGSFSIARTDSRQAQFTTTTTVAEVVTAVVQAYSDGPGDGYTPQTVTLTPPSTLNGPAGVPVTCDYTVSNALGSVRIQKHLGTTTQTVDGYLTGAVPGQWVSTDRLRGLAYCVVTLDLEDTRFQGGPPNIVFDISGRKVYDPRASTTAWSANPALCIRDFLIGPWGYEVATGDVDDASINTAANACDATITLDVGGVTTAGQPTYTCNGVFTTLDSREKVLEDLCQCMAGYAVYGAQWRTLAGTWTASVMTLTDDDLDGQIEIVQAGAGMDDLFNGVRGTYVAAGKVTPTDFDAYQNSTFVSSDGRELWTDLTLPYTDNRARARNLSRIFVERARSSQVIRYPAKLRAWPLQIGDRVTVTSAEYGFSSKTYRVTDWQFGITAPVLLTLQEDVAGTYDLADAATADPSPNTDLPNPWAVASISGLSAASGTAQLIRTLDGTIVARVLVSWTAVSDAYIVDGSGRIEMLWRRPGSTVWRQVNLPGDATKGWIEQVRETEQLLIEVRAVNGLQVRGPSSFLAHTVVGKTALPAMVAGFAAAALPGGVGISWTPSTELDYQETEVRYGASWGAGTRIYQGPGERFTWPWPTAGSYTLRAKHRDTTGNEGATDATVSITVGNSSLIDTGSLVPGSVTVIDTQTATAVTITTVSGVPNNTSTFWTDIATYTFTAAHTGSVLVTAIGSLSVSTPVGATGTAVYAEVSTSIDVGSVYGSTLSFQVDLNIGANKGYQGNIAHTREIAVTAGSSYTVTLRAQKLDTTVTTTVATLTMRTEQIKR